MVSYVVAIRGTVPWQHLPTVAYHVAPAALNFRKLQCWNLGALAAMLSLSVTAMGAI